MEYKRLFDAFYCQQEMYPNPTALNDKINGKKWVHYSTADCIEKINKVSCALLKMGVKEGENFAIISPNRPEWAFADMGILQVGGITVPIYPNISEDEYRFIFNDAGIKLVFIEDKNIYKKIAPLKDEISGLKIISFAEVEGEDSFDSFLATADDALQDEVETRKSRISGKDLATIIYTSGTTGTPKGVMLSHKNIIDNATNAWKLIPLTNKHRVTTMLPICHIFERTVTYLVIYAGASLYIIDRLELVGEYIREVKPHFFSTVPRLLEKIYEKIVMKGTELTGIKKKIFFWSLRLAEKFDTPSGKGILYNIQLSIADRLVFKKWRAALGGEVWGIVSGAAALQPRLGRIFSAAGIPIKEGYGQTESSPVICLNSFFNNETKFGTVGKVIPGVEIKIADDGEILAKGSNVMMGYYKRPDLTAETLKDGWLHTGDIGTVDSEGFLKITDRKKELFKTSGGKYVAPQSIENRFKESFFVEHIMVVGENKKTISALIVPSATALGNWAKEKNISYTDTEDLLRQKEVIKLYNSIRDEMNKHFGEVEKVKRIVLIPDVWGIDSGELTPTLKLKRKFIMAKYKDTIDSIYAHENMLELQH